MAEVALKGTLGLLGDLVTAAGIAFAPFAGRGFANEADRQFYKNTYFAWHENQPSQSLRKVVGAADIVVRQAEQAIQGLTVYLGFAAESKTQISFSSILDF